jgi:hypothetical protein
MSIVEQLKLINIPTATAAIILVFSIFAPGSLIIFYFDRALFLELDILKLLLLSIALTIPSLFIPYIIAIVAKGHDRNFLQNISEHEHLDLLLEHGANSGTSIYLALTICFLFDLSFKLFIIIFALLAIAHIIAEIILQSKKIGLKRRSVQPHSD